MTDSHKKTNFQLSSIRILTVARPSWFCRSELIIRDKQMFCVRLRIFLGEFDQNLIIIIIIIIYFFFFTIFLNFFPIEPLFSAKKMAQFKTKYR